MLTQSPAAVPAAQSRTWSIAAFAAEAADDAPRASMILAPRCCTVGMYVALDPRLVDAAPIAGLPFTRACTRSGYCVAEWLPQIVMLRDGTDGHVALLRELRLGPVVVEPHHRGEALARDRARVVHRDQAVRVGRVADDEDPHVVGRARRERLALRGEDRAVHLEQLAALHPLRPRPGADEQRVVHAGERPVRVVGLLDACEQRERAVVELHRHAGERGKRGRDLEQMQDHGLVLAEHLAARDAEQQAVADLTGSARHRDAYGIVVTGRLRAPLPPVASLSSPSSVAPGKCPNSRR